MTFTPTYIKMMEKSPVQKEWKPKVGDWFEKQNNIYLIYFCKLTGMANQSIFYFSQDGNHVGTVRQIENAIWLPLEGDWWEMIDGDTHAKIFRFYYGSKKYQFTGTTPYVKLTTILELLAAFVHWQKWGLRWDGEQWIT
jgi:hypothetical protein